MAATTVMHSASESLDGYGYEIVLADIGGAETECDITASKLTSISSVAISAMDAASAAAAIGYLKDTFVPGSNACTIVGDNSTQYLVMLIGRIAS